MFRTRGIAECLYKNKNYLVVRIKLVKPIKEVDLFKNIIYEYGGEGLKHREDTEAGVHSLSYSSRGTNAGRVFLGSRYM